MTRPPPATRRCSERAAAPTRRIRCRLRSTSPSPGNRLWRGRRNDRCSAAAAPASTPPQPAAAVAVAFGPRHSCSCHATGRALGAHPKHQHRRLETAASAVIAGSRRGQSRRREPPWLQRPTRRRPHLGPTRWPSLWTRLWAAALPQWNPCRGHGPVPARRVRLPNLELRRASRAGAVWYKTYKHGPIGKTRQSRRNSNETARRCSQRGYVTL